MINSTWLRTFSVLADTKNFRLAAEMLHMTQPGVSQHIAKLEQFLGQKLIVRDGKSFEVTPKGFDVLEYARELIQNEQQLRERISDDDPFSGLCRISMPGGIGNLIYPWLLDLQVKFPSLTIHIEFNPTKTVEQLVADNLCDIGLVTHEINNGSIERMPFLSEKLWLVLPENIECTSFSQLQQLGFVDHPDGKKMAEKVLPLIFPEEFTGSDRMHVSAYTNSAPKICHHVAKGVGYTVLDEFMVRLSPEFKKLKIVNSDSISSDEIAYIYKGSWPLHPRNRYIIDYLNERAKHYLQQQSRF